MTPKDKAGLLIATVRKTLFENGNPNNVNDHSRACAIACVEEILPLASDHNITIGRNGLSDKEYWNKVLEILKAKQNGA